MSGPGLEDLDVSGMSELNRSLFLYVFMHSTQPTGRYPDSKRLENREIALSAGWYRVYVDPSLTPEIVSAEPLSLPGKALKVTVRFSPTKEFRGKFYLCSEGRLCFSLLSEIM